MSLKPAATRRGTGADRLPPLLERLDPAHGVRVGDRWINGDLGTFEVEDPADGSVIAAVADAGAVLAREAVGAAAQAGAAWAATSPRGRSEALTRIFGLMLQQGDDLASLITAENGKPTSEARAEVAYAAEFFRWYAEEAVRPHGDFGSAPAGGVRTFVTSRPVGVAALVTPWNFPAAMAARKIAPALAAGCTVVLKPAVETPLSALALARLIEQAGIPAGVVNIVPTSHPAEVVGAWLSDPRVRKLSFTGSTAVGRRLLGQAADLVMATSMELGGNAAFVVMEDADVTAAVDGAMLAKFRGGGQACTAANRFYVHPSVQPAFVESLSHRVRQLRVGRGSDPGTEIGPLISRRAVAGVQELVDDAVERGAQVVARAELPACPGGNYLAPMLLTDVAPDSRLVLEEVFGPVAPVVTWEDRDDLLEMINGTEMGLAAYLYSRDLKSALQLAESIEAGMVGINRGLVSDPSAPFGGMKQSGLGREGARAGMAEYQETQYFSVDWA